MNPTLSVQDAVHIPLKDKRAIRGRSKDSKYVAEMQQKLKTFHYDLCDFKWTR